LSLPNDFSISNTVKRALRRRPRAKAVERQASEVESAEQNPEDFTG
jgi:hypothetical protein